MEFGSEFGEPFYTGTATSSEVPGRFPVALAGHAYLMDLTRYSRRTVPIRRQPFDTGQDVGEQSLNTEGLWTRSAADWSLGSGQTYYDNEDSERRRFSRSLGVDVWERDLLTLLPGTEEKRSSANTNLRMLTAGTRLYIADGNTVLFTTDPTVASPTWTTVTATPAAAVTDLATDGYNVYAAFGASNLYVIGGGGTSAAALGTSDATVVGYANGRLLAGHLNKVFEVDAAGTFTEEFSHPLTAWVVRGFTSSPTHGYFFGDTGGGDSTVYRISVADDGSLTTPVYAGAPPAGETLHAMAYYGGVMLLATSAGIRIAEIAGDGSLLVGKGVEIDGGSQCVTAEGQYAWFGWDTPYGEAYSGLGRADLSDTTEDGTPPYATDLQVVSATGTPTSVASFGGRRYFALSGDGFYGATDELVASGWIESGRIRFGTLERKITVAASVGHEPLDGAVTIAVRDDTTADFTEVGTSDTADTVKPVEEFAATGYGGEWTEVRLVLERDAADDEAGPQVRRWLLRGLPSPRRVREILAPLILRAKVSTSQGASVYQDVFDEVAFIEGLEDTGQLVTYQEGSRSYQVYVDRVDLSPNSATDLRWSDERDVIEGVLICRLIST